MADTYIIANWKSHFTRQQAQNWLAEFSKLYHQEEGKHVIICPPDLLAPLIADEVAKNRLAVSMGLQDFSPFPSGSHTGEEPPELASEFAKYAIIGHSERRRELGETDALIAKKAASALSQGVTPIVCVQAADTPLPENVKFIAYEPLFAIGSGTPDTPENAESVAKTIASQSSGATMIYGGSVTAENVRSFTEKEILRGVLIGGASLEPEAFVGIIHNA